MANEILNNLMSIKQRIDGQRAALAAELEKLEAEKEQIAAGHFEKPSGFVLEDVLAGNQTTPIAEINRKIGNIKAALDLPYYADGEYRTASLAYMTAMAEEATAEIAANDAAVEAAEAAVATAEANLAAAREQGEDIRSAMCDKLNNVGLWNFAHNASYCTPERLLEKYTDICSKYN